jgi:hypothetical protein
MRTSDGVLRESLLEAKNRSLKVYRHDKGQPGAERAASFALGRSEGLHAALKLLAKRRREGPRAEPARLAGPQSPPCALPSFSAIFQKLRPKHSPAPLGRW